MIDILLDENGNTINMHIDYVARRETIQQELDERIFSNISDDDIYDRRYDKDGNETSKKKRTVKKNEVSPTVTASRVQSVIDSILILEEPMDLTTAKSLEPAEYRKACSEYFKLVDYINRYVPFRANKQTYCGFVGLLNDDFETLISDTYYGSTFKRIRDSFVGGAFVDASSGLYDTSAIIAESQTRGDGLNLIKNPEQINYSVNNTLNYTEMDSFAKSISGLLGGATKKLPKKEK